MGEVEDIKREHFNALLGRDVVLIVKHDYGFQVESWSKDGVAPTSDYDTPQEAAGRVLQLLGIKEPVAPQDHPEIAQISDGHAMPPRRSPRP